VSLGDCSLIIEWDDANNCKQGVPIVIIVTLFFRMLNETIPNACEYVNEDTESEYSKQKREFLMV